MSDSQTDRTGLFHDRDRVLIIDTQNFDTDLAHGRVGKVTGDGIFTFVISILSERSRLISERRLELISRAERRRTDVDC